MTSPRAAVVLFPGSNRAGDFIRAWRLAHGRAPDIVWHDDAALPENTDLVVLPGGFSYGDYLRAGAIARFAPVMESVIEFANEGGLVLGICNGFQILCEAGLLPGALLDNESLKFVFRQVRMDVVDRNTPFTRNCPPTLSIPVKHMSGRYYSPEPVQVVLRYVAGHNPNGSQDDIAGVVNNAGNVFGLMPHPEHAVDPLTGSEDGLTIFESIRAAVDERVWVA
jgi:phosphoribosylformylglycinamidine synthase